MLTIETEVKRIFLYKSGDKIIHNKITGETFYYQYQPERLNPETSKEDAIVRTLQ